MVMRFKQEPHQEHGAWQCAIDCLPASFHFSLASAVRLVGFPSLLLPQTSFQLFLSTQENIA
jgi:hypothetical protein